MEQEIATTLKALRARHINTEFAKTAAEATTKLLTLIPKERVVGLDGSATVSQIGIVEALKQRGTRVRERTAEAEFRDRITTCDIFLTGTNVVTQDGRLLNLDGYGSRIAGIVWGHPQTIIVVGKNKIVKDLDEGFDRLRHVIAPNHIKIRVVDLGGRRHDTPCAKTGQCVDCRTKDRACNVFQLIEGRPLGLQLTVMMVDEDLGLAWDEAWPQDRINKIIENYKRFVWVPH